MFPFNVTITLCSIRIFHANIPFECSMQMFHSNVPCECSMRMFNANVPSNVSSDVPPTALGDGWLDQGRVRHLSPHTSARLCMRRGWLARARMAVLLVCTHLHVYTHIMPEKIRKGWSHLSTRMPTHMSTHMSTHIFLHRRCLASSQGWRPRMWPHTFMHGMSAHMSMRMCVHSGYCSQIDRAHMCMRR